MVSPSSPDGYSRTDWPYRILVAALFAVAAWLLAMPFVPAIARCTMSRFHLRTGSFTTWAVQQPIPPMYSFANTTRVREQPPGRADTSGTVIAGRTINHFPTREFTFANARVRYLQAQSPRWFVLRSQYRGQSLESTYQLMPSGNGGWSVTLQPHESLEDVSR